MEKSLDAQIVEVYNENKGMFYNITRRHRIHTDEIQSLGYVAVWKALKTFNGKVKFSTHLWNIYTRDCNKFREKESNQSRVPHQAAKSNHTFSVYNDLEDMISSLTEQEKYLVRCRVIDDLSYREIGEQYEVTPQAIHQTLEKIWAKLKCNTTYAS